MYYEKECLYAFSSREITPCIIYKVSTRKTIYMRVQYRLRRIRKQIRNILKKNNI